MTIETKSLFLEISANSLQDLFDEKKRYVHNDSIIISADICVFPSSNLI